MTDYLAGSGAIQCSNSLYECSGGKLLELAFIVYLFVMMNVCCSICTWFDVWKGLHFTVRKKLPLEKNVHASRHLFVVEAINLGNHRTHDSLKFNGVLWDIVLYEALFNNEVLLNPHWHKGGGG